ncbi:unnamed protein product [Gulo gulo]|uniref:Uncharacterized protein n=1 Tax=Gulo gulo TaxID=48420 RepID=A0A9X9LL04_GULGU|nr:unnamed protein product [Gulo gulo]
MPKYVKQGYVQRGSTFCLLVSFHNSSCFKIFSDFYFLFLFFFNFTSLPHISCNLPRPYASILDFSPSWHPSGELTQNGLPRCFSSLLPPTSCLGRTRGPRAAPAGRVSIGDILAGPSVALPPLHPVTHVRPAALSHAASASGTQPRAPAFRTPDPSW